MTALSINLPDSITKESTVTAKKLGISRTEFIRRAIMHELEDFRRNQLQEEMIKSFSLMKKSDIYAKTANRLINDFADELPSEEDFWWKKK